MVGDFVHAIVGNIADRNAVLAGGGQIDVVDADAVTDDRFDPLHGGDDLGSERGILTDDGVGIADQCDQFGFVGLHAGDQFAAMFFEHAGFDVESVKLIVGDNNFFHGVGGF